MKRARWKPKLCWTGLLALTLAQAAAAAEGDTIADRVLGQKRLSTSIPYFVDGRVFGATDVAIDRSVLPNRIYLADANLNRVLGWSDIGRFRAGDSADLVLGQPTLFTGALVLKAKACPLPPSATSFCRPSLVEVDHRGNLYVVDLFNDRVLEFDSPFLTDRVADRVFGQPDFGSRGSAGSDSRDWISSREGLAVDGAGNVWMVDPAASRRILEFDDPLTHDTLADRVIEPATTAECLNPPPNLLCQPFDLKVSPQGDLYVQDFGAAFSGGSRFHVFRQPLTTDLVPDFVLASGYIASEPFGVVFDPAGNLYTVGGFFISRVPAPIGPGSQGEVIAGPFKTEVSGQQDRDSEGNFYVAYHAYPSYEGNFVYFYRNPFRSEPKKIRRPLLSDRGLSQPFAVAVDRSSSPNHLYVADSTNRVLGWRDAAGFANGAPADLILDGNDPARDFCNYVDSVVDASRFCGVGGLAVDSRGNLWLADGAYHRVLEFDRPFESDGVADRVLGQGRSFTSRTCNKGGPSARSLCRPGALAFDSRDNLYVADLSNQRVLLFLNPLNDAVADKVFGQADFQQGRGCNRGDFSHPRADSLCFGFEEGSINVHFTAASGLAVDPQDNLYVADSHNARVLIFKDAARSDNRPEAVLGQDGSFRKRLAGTGPKRFGGFQRNDVDAFGPTGLAIGPAGELYVVDSPNDRLLVFADPLHDDTATRVFGHADFDAGGAMAPLDVNTPPASPSRLFRPSTAAIDAAGNLYVADTGYNRALAYDRP